jgi:glycosyltransferase involved in cell wall biosynthesis
VRDVDGLVFVLVGDGPEKERLMARSRDLDLARLRFVEARPREEMPVLLASADIALVPLGLSLPGAVPSKIYEAMGAGVPIVLIAEGEAAAIVSGSGAGRVVAPGDIDGIAAALRELASHADRRSDLGRAGRAAALRDFDRTRIADGFIRHLESRSAC